MNRRYVVRALAVTISLVATSACSDSQNRNFAADLLDDKAVAIYISTTQDSKFFRNGQVILGRRDGTVESIRTDGLPGGQLAYDGGRNLVISDRNSDTLLGANGRDHTRNVEESQGTLATWLPGNVNSYHCSMVVSSRVDTCSESGGASVLNQNQRT